MHLEKYYEEESYDEVEACLKRSWYNWEIWVRESDKKKNMHKEKQV